MLYRWYSRDLARIFQTGLAELQSYIKPVWLPEVECRGFNYQHKLWWRTHFYPRRHNQHIYISKTYEPIHLYTPLSANPNSCFKGFVTGKILCYWSQNSNKQDFISITSQFIQWLVNRGLQLQEIIKYIKSAAILIDNTATGTYNRSITINKKTDYDNTLYIHWCHHPYDIPKQTLRNIYNHALKDIDSFAHVRIVTSRPKK